MAFISTIALIVLGVVLIAVGLVTGSSWAYLFAVVCSALAVGILWVKASRSDTRPRVRNLPAPSQPDWDRPVRSAPPRESLEDSRETLPPVAINDYENLLASEIVPSLETLSVEQLRAVIAREEHGLKRPRIIERAQKLIDLTTGTTREPVTAASRAVDLRADREAVSRSTGPARAPRRPPNKGDELRHAQNKQKSHDISLE